MKRLVFSILTLSALLVMGAAQEGAISPAQRSLVEAERAFARLSVEKGTREAFLTWFAEDGINFQPGPVNTKEAFRKLPATRPPVVLNWAPVYGDLSQAGDLGYSTGPYTLEDHGPQHRPPQHGLFFSIWKKQADGSWKVAIDCGVRTPQAAAGLEDPFVPAASSARAGKTPPEVEALDRAFFETAKAKGIAAAWKAHLADSARIYRWNEMPVHGKAAIGEWIAKQTTLPSVEWIKTGVAASNDLAYSYGSIEINGSSKPVKGFYVRIWKPDAQGNWRIVFDIGFPGE